MVETAFEAHWLVQLSASDALAGVITAFAKASAVKDLQAPVRSLWSRCVVGLPALRFVGENTNKGENN